jgi:hypothetical protein
MQEEFIGYRLEDYSDLSMFRHLGRPVVGVSFHERGNAVRAAEWGLREFVSRADYYGKVVPQEPVDLPDGVRNPTWFYRQAGATFEWSENSYIATITWEARLVGERREVKEAIVDGEVFKREVAEEVVITDWAPLTKVDESWGLVGHACKTVPVATEYRLYLTAKKYDFADEDWAEGGTDTPVPA